MDAVREDKQLEGEGEEDAEEGGHGDSGSAAVA